MQLTDSQKQDLANILKVAWIRYEAAFHEPPNSTQMRALVEYMRLDDFVRGIVSHAIDQAFADEPPEFAK